MIKEISIRTSSRNEFVDITSEIQKIVKESGVKEGICVVFAPHTTAAVTINEGADPDVVQDIQNKLNQLVPSNSGYAHTEGNADSHIKSTLVGCSETLIIKNGSLLLGTWQSCFFCEFDGPRNRKVFVKILK